jgi:hypothetical protein
MKIMFLLLLIIAVYSSDSTPTVPACPVSMTSPLLTACKCEGEATLCAVGKFCYTGGCKENPECTRPEIEKNILYGA